MPDEAVGAGVHDAVLGLPGHAARPQLPDRQPRPPGEREAGNRGQDERRRGDEAGFPQDGPAGAAAGVQAEEQHRAGNHERAKQQLLAEGRPSDGTVAPERGGPPGNQPGEPQASDEHAGICHGANGSTCTRRAALRSWAAVYRAQADPDVSRGAGREARRSGSSPGASPSRSSTGRNGSCCCSRRRILDGTLHGSSSCTFPDPGNSRCTRSWRRGRRRSSGSLVATRPHDPPFRPAILPGSRCSAPAAGARCRYSLVS